MTKGWGRPFEEPIEIAGRGPLRSLREAGEYIAGPAQKPSSNCRTGRPRQRP